VVNSEHPGRWTPSGAPWTHQATIPYLAVSADGASWWTSTPTAVPRQFFRRVIATNIGLAGRYDYDAYPFHANAAATVSAWFDRPDVSVSNAPNGA
jgi:hypothetical protein